MAGLGVSRTKKRSDYGLLGHGTVRRGAFAKSSYQTGNTYFRLAKVGQEGYNTFQNGRAGAMFRAPETGIRGILSKSFTAFRPGATLKSKASAFRELAYHAGSRKLAASQRPGLGSALVKGVTTLAPRIHGKGILGRVGRFARQVQGFQRQGGAVGYIGRRLSGSADTVFKRREAQVSGRQQQAKQQKQQAQQQAQQQRAQAQQQRNAEKAKRDIERETIRQQREADKKTREESRIMRDLYAEDRYNTQKKREADRQKLKTGKELQTIGRQAIKSKGGMSVTRALQEITKPTKPQKQTKLPKQVPAPELQPQAKAPKKSKQSVVAERETMQMLGERGGRFRGAIGGVRRAKLGAQLREARAGAKAGKYTLDDVIKAKENIKQGKSAIGILRKDQPQAGAAPGTQSAKTSKQPKQPRQPQTQQSPADVIIKNKDAQTNRDRKKAEEMARAQTQATTTTGKKAPKMTAKDLEKISKIAPTTGKAAKDYEKKPSGGKRGRKCIYCTPEEKKEAARKRTKKWREKNPNYKNPKRGISKVKTAKI